MVAQSTILHLLEERPMSTVDMAEILGTTSTDVGCAIPQLIRYDLIRIVGYTSIPFHPNLRVYALDDWHGPVQCDRTARLRGGRIPTIPASIGKALKTATEPMTIRRIAGRVYDKAPEHVTTSQMTCIRNNLTRMEQQGRVRRTRMHEGARNHPADVWELVA